MAIIHCPASHAYATATNTSNDGFFLVIRMRSGATHRGGVFKIETESEFFMMEDWGEDRKYAQYVWIRRADIESATIEV